MVLSAFYAITGAFRRVPSANEESTANPVEYYEPDFKGDDDEMDYSLPQGLVERHGQDKLDDE